MQIVVGLTDRPESRAALEHASREAELRRAHLHLVRTMGQGLSGSSSSTQGWGRALDDARKEGEKLVGQLAQRGIDATLHVEPIDTDASATLLQVASEVDAGLIVIGIRRRTPVGKLVLGSVAQDILLHADCSVLAVKAENDERP